MSRGAPTRLLVAVLPMVALLATWPDQPALWLVVVVGLLSAGWAWRPESPAGLLALLAVAGWWLVSSDGAVGPGVLVAAVALLGAHLAALLLSYGPPGTVVDRRLVTLWVRRGAVSLLPALVAWGVLRLLDDVVVPDALWAATVAALLVLVLLAAAAVRTEPHR